MPMCESYIVRIYRRSKKDPETIVGLVEVVGTGEIRKFSSLNDLGTALYQKGRQRKSGKSGQGEEEAT